MFELLGRVSYSIYMVHALIIGVALRAATALEQATGQSFSFTSPIGGGTARFVSHGDAWTMDALVAIYVLAVVGLARWTWGAIEMPCQHWWNGLAFTGSAPGESASAVRSPASA